MPLWEVVSTFLVIFWFSMVIASCGSPFLMKTHIFNFWSSDLSYIWLFVEKKLLKQAKPTIQWSQCLHAFFFLKPSRPTINSMISFQHIWLVKNLEFVSTLCFVFFAVLGEVFFRGDPLISCEVFLWRWCWMEWYVIGCDWCLLKCCVLLLLGFSVFCFEGYGGCLVYTHGWWWVYGCTVDREEAGIVVLGGEVFADQWW